MKKIIVILFFLLCLCMPVKGAEQYFYDNGWHMHSVSEMCVALDGIPVTFDVPPLIVENYTLIPVRGLFEAIGAKVEWNDNLRQVTIESQSGSVILTIGKTSALINGNTCNMPLAAKIVTDKYGVSRTMIPLRAVSEALSYDVSWNADTKTANVSTIPLQGEDLSVPLNREAQESVIVLDAGHGGSDPGIVITNAMGKIDVQEKDISLDIARRIKRSLEALGLQVIMTRDSDTYVGLSERAEIGNQENATLFISIHCNSYIDKSMRGSMAYCFFSENQASTFSGKTLADNILNEVVWAVGTENKGIQNGYRFPVITETDMPAVIVETAFLSNAEDKEILKNPVGRQNIAKAIARGIVKSLNLLHPEK